MLRGMIYVLWSLSAHEYEGPFVSYDAAVKYAKDNGGAWSVEYQSIRYANRWSWARGWQSDV